MQMNVMKKQTTNSTLEKHSNRRGAVTVEFALMLPVAMMITLGLVEFSRVNMIRNTAQNAAYEGARQAIIPGGTAASAKAKADSILAIVRTKNATVSISPATITNSTPKITVTISIPLGDNMWITPKYVTNTTMVKKCTLTRESTQSGF